MDVAGYWAETQAVEPLHVALVRSGPPLGGVEPPDTLLTLQAVDRRGSVARRTSRGLPVQPARRRAAKATAGFAAANGRNSGSRVRHCSPGSVFPVSLDLDSDRRARDAGEELPDDR